MSQGLLWITPGIGGSSRKKTSFTAEHAEILAEIAEKPPGLDCEELPEYVNCKSPSGLQSAGYH